MVNILFLLTVIPIAFACQAGSSADDLQLIQNPTFTFMFNPPIAWTYLSPVNATALVFAGQSASQADAQRRIQTDFDSAIFKALSTIGVSSSGVTYQFSGYTPQDCLVRGPESAATAGARAVGTCIPEVGAIVAIRTVVDTDQGTPFDFTGTVNVRNAPLATKGQWKVIANEVWKNLYLGSNVRFLSPITITSG